MNRCEWALSSDLMMAYHDREWGVPRRDDQVLFEFLLLEGFQAGLSWETILKKRESMRVALDGFDPEKIARYGMEKIEYLLLNEGIIRNRSKVMAAVNNSRVFLELERRYGSFAHYLWGLAGGKSVHNSWVELEEIPSQTPLSVKISKELKKEGFKFVGPTICYAFMQAVGMVNDHLVSCFRYDQLKN